MRDVKVSSWSQFKAILHKDIVMELRTKEMLTSMGLYSLLVLIVYAIGLAQVGTKSSILNIAAGLLWIAIIFTSLLGLNRSLVHEKDQGCLEALLLSPIDRPVIFFGKAVGNMIFLFIVEVITLPMFYFFFLQNEKLGSSPLLLIGPVLVGTIGIAGVGTLLATMTVNTKGKDFILAILFIPAMFPLLYACVGATNAVILRGEGLMGMYWNGMAIGAGYDIIMILLAYALYEFIIDS